MAAYNGISQYLFACVFILFAFVCHAMNSTDIVPLGLKGPFLDQCPLFIKYNSVL